MSDITLSAGVRQNLLSLQNTASLMALTQNRLATGKKVNSALDNPSNFFTSQSLSDRAGDLNALLDSIGQAQKTLEAADKGLTSLTKLVQSAKSVAQQARQSTLAAATYAAVNASGSVAGTESIATAQGADLSPRAIGLSFTTQTETTGTLTGTNTLGPKPISLSFSTDAEILGSTGNGAAITVANATNYDFSFNGQDVRYTSDGSADISEIIGGLQAQFVAAAAAAGLTAGVDVELVANAGNNGIEINALRADVDITIANHSGSSTNNVGIANGSYNSTSLLDNIGTSGQTLAIASTGNSTRTVTFTASAGADNVSTLAELDAWVTANAGTGVTADVTGTTMTFAFASGAGNFIGLTASNAGLRDALGLNAAQTAVNLTNGTNRGGFGTSALTRTFNSDVTLAEIDPTNLSGATNDLVINLDKGDGVAASNVTITLANTDTLATALTKIQANPTLSGAVTASIVGNQLQLDAANVKVDFTVNSGSFAAKALGLTADENSNSGTAGHSINLLDRITAAGGSSGATLVLDATGNGGARTITFAKGLGTNGNVSTLAELSAYISNNGGIIGGGVAGNTFSLSVTAGSGKSLAVTTSNAGIKTALGLNVAETNVDGAGANRGGLGTDPTKLTRTFNSDPTIGELDASLLTSGANFTISIDKNDGNGYQAQTVGLAANDKLSDVVTKLQANTTINDNLNVTIVSGRLTFTSKTADIDFEITSNAASTVLNAGGGGTLLTANQGHSTSLLDNLLTAGGALDQTLTIAANGGSAQTLTFGKGENKISTMAELAIELGKLTGGITASLTGSTISVAVASSANATSLTIGGDDPVINQLGLTVSKGTQSGAKTDGADSATRTSLQKDYNDVLSQIDTLAKDASYNGINLLNGDDLKVTFNEDGTSSLTIKGARFDSISLGMNQQTGTQFQDNTQIDSIIGNIDGALTTLRTQASKFGSSLTTVQTRQDFTKNLINTLQTGADALVLADSNEEGANLLALQTRQQLSSTALSLSAQADQAVLRLFG
jgi:flagellin